MANHQAACPGIWHTAVRFADGVGKFKRQTGLAGVLAEKLLKTRHAAAGALFQLDRTGYCRLLILEWVHFAHTRSDGWTPSQASIFAALSN